MPRPRLKWLAFGALAIIEFACIYAVGALWVVDMGDGIEWVEWRIVMGEPEAIPWLGGLALGIVGAQAALLVPMRRPRAASEGTPLAVSLASAALACALLLGGALWLLLEFLGLWEPAMDHEATALLIIAAPIPAWILVTPLLVYFCRRRARQERLLGRVAAALFLGSVVEALAAIPLDVMIRRRTDCYCGEATFFTLTVCGTVGLYAFGPAIFLPLLARRRKRWYAGRCEVCGYDMTGVTSADQCPECGAGWRAQRNTPEAEAPGV